MSEKIDGGNGRLYTKDHPHEIISPHIMRFKEIREWLTVLTNEPAYGWTDGGVAGLSRALGFSTPSSMIRKLTTAWIWPKEQVRISARIRQVLDGYIVPQRFGLRVDGVYTDPPRPPAVGNRPKCVTIRAAPGRLQYAPPHASPPMKLPSFARAFSEAIVWDPDAKKRRRF